MLAVHYKLAERSFCKTEWTKPKHVDKLSVEGRSGPPSLSSPGHRTVRYGELWKAWYTIEYELFNAFTRNGSFFTTCSSLDPKTTKKSDDKTIDKNDYSNYGDSTRHVDAIIRTYSELKALSSPLVKKSGFSTNLDTDNTIEATLNTTTKNIEEEKLAQKLETIEEVPLVEADPNIVKPPETTGPTVMNLSKEDYEEFARHSDFQIEDDHIRLEEIPESPNLINNYFQKQNCGKPNFDAITLTAVPEVKLDEDISLTELLKRVRTRNRLLRCRDIDHQFYTTETMDDKTNFPQHQNPYLPPGWGWPSTPEHQPYKHEAPHPHVANPSPQKAKPITPDDRPEYNRTGKVNAKALALYLGPLVTAFRSATILFPLLAASLIPDCNSDNNFSNDKLKEDMED